MRIRLLRSIAMSGTVALTLVLSSCQSSTESRQRNLGIEENSDAPIINTFTTTKKASEAYVAVDKDENIYSVNDQSSFVTKIDAQGNTNAKWTDIGSTSSSGIEVDANGSLYVLISDKNLVKKFDSSGNFLRDYLVGKTPSSITIDLNGNIYISNIGDNSISKITPNGELVMNWYKDTSPLTNVVNPPSSIEADTLGNVYSIVCGQNAVNQISPSGNLLKMHYVVQPIDLTITPDNTMYIVNKTNLITKIIPISNTITTIETGRQFDITKIESSKNGNIYFNNIVKNNDSSYIYQLINNKVVSPILIEPKQIFASNIICGNFNNNIYTVNNLMLTSTVNYKNINYINSISEIVMSNNLILSSSSSSTMPDVAPSSSSSLNVPLVSTSTSTSTSSSSSTMPDVAPSSSSSLNVPLVSTSTSTSTSSSSSTMPDVAPSSSSPSLAPVTSLATVADLAKTSTSVENVGTVAPVRSAPDVVVTSEVIANAVSAGEEKTEGIVVSPKTTEVVCDANCVEALLKTTGVVDGEVSVVIGDAAPVLLPKDNQLKLSVGSKDSVMKFVVRSPEGKETVVNVPVTHSSSVPEPESEPSDSSMNLYLIIAGVLILLGGAGYFLRRKIS